MVHEWFVETGHPRACDNQGYYIRYYNNKYEFFPYEYCICFQDTPEEDIRQRIETESPTYTFSKTQIQSEMNIFHQDSELHTFSEDRFTHCILSNMCKETIADK